MKCDTRKILIASGITTAVSAILASTTYLFTKKMVRIALDRDTPRSLQKSIQRISGTKKEEELLKLVRKNEQMLKNKKFKEIEIESYDGEKLAGHLYENEKEKRIIIAMHGWRSSWSTDFGMISEFWHNNDCSVLYAEQRGQNNSGGKYMSFGLTERYDCLSWVRWLNENGKKNVPVYLAGISMGATTVLMASGLELPDNVCGILADCGFTSPYAIYKHVMENNLHFYYKSVEAIANGMFKKRINMGANDYSTTDALCENKIPVLFIHGTDDHFVPVEMTYENYKACKAPKEMLIVPGAEHARSYLTEKEKYENTVKEFWKKYDKKADLPT